VSRNPHSYLGRHLVVVIDCGDLDRSARFWASVLGYARDGPPGGPYQGLVPADGQGIEILLQQVPEVKSGRTGSTWICALLTLTARSTVSWRWGRCG